MRKFFYSFLCILSLLQPCLAQSSQDTGIQQKDSVPILKKKVSRRDSLPPVSPQKKKDTSLLMVPKRDSIITPAQDTTSIQKTASSRAETELVRFRSALKKNPWFNFSGKAETHEAEIHKPLDEDGYFYLFVGLVFYFGLIKVLFARYFDYLLTVFLRASLRQQQIREQLQQSPLPSLLLNLLFSVTGGLYVAFLVKHYGLVQDMNYALLSVYCCFLVGLLYLVKFFVLKTAGWVFNISKVTDTYIFIVFMVNKVLGILLLPILILLYFSSGTAKEIVLTISLFITGFLLLYRLIATYPAVRSEIKVSVLYFFLYLCAFEIAPLLLIYKVLLTYLEKAY